MRDKVKKVSGRRHKRIPKAFITWLKVVPPGAGEDSIPYDWEAVTAHNIGAGGISFNYNKEVDEDSLINMMIKVPFSRTPIKCVGKVVRNDQVLRNDHTFLYHIVAIFEWIQKKEKELIDSAAEEFHSKKEEDIWWLNKDMRKKKLTEIELDTPLVA